VIVPESAPVGNGAAPAPTVTPLRASSWAGAGAHNPGHQAAATASQAELSVSGPNSDLGMNPAAPHSTARAA
jgi:hypothetical protein